jgi:uncharacterized oxidoreductase
MPGSLTVFITSSTSGIEFALTERYLAVDHTVIVSGRREDRLEAIKEAHPSIHTIAGDVSSAQNGVKLYEEVISNFPDVNVLVNNAGI